MLISALREAGAMIGTDPLTLILICNGAIAAALALYAWSRRIMVGVRSFIAITVLLWLASWAFAVEIESGSSATRTLWMQVRLSVAAVLPLAFLAMCLENSGRGSWMSSRWWGVPLALSAGFVGLIVTNPRHLWVFGPVPGDSSIGSTFMLGASAGPAFRIYTAYTGVLGVFGILLLVDYAIREGGIARRQSILLISAMALPPTASLLSLRGLGAGVLAGPFTYGAALLLIAIAIFRYGLLDIVPIARATVFNEIGDGVLVFDGARRVLDANGAAMRLLGLTATPIRQRAGDLFGVWPPVLEALDAGTRATIEIEHGSDRFELVITPLSSESAVAGHLVIIHDVTEARRAAAALQAATRARGDFLARVSHEIRTPMNGVIGLSGLLLQTSLEDRQRAYARGVRQSAQALLRLVNDVLDFSRIDAGRLSLEVCDFEPRESLAAAIDLVRPEAHTKGLPIASDTDADVPFAVCGDAGRLRQILINLLGNAVKFTSVGEVAAHMGLESVSADAVVLRITVSDTGIGIAPDAMERIFQPFVQADVTRVSQYGGSGLGLAISKQLAELMGGRIDVFSQVGRGSRFVVTLPMARAVARAAIDAEVDGDDLIPARRWSARALVAEDNPVNQLVIVQMLESRGITADVAANGLEAVDAWLRVPYDLVLMDCRMPEMDGYEATREIRRRDESRRRTPIVAMTADALPADRARCLEAGMDDHIAKPVRARDLESALTRFLPAAAASFARPDADAVDELRVAMGMRFTEVVDQYLADARSSLDALREAGARHDDRTVEAIAHRLKGSSGLVRASAVVRLCQELVENPRDPIARIDQLSAELIRVRARLHAQVHADTQGQA